MAKIKLPRVTHCSPARYCHHRHTGTCLVAGEILQILRANDVVVPAGSTHPQLVKMLQVLTRRLDVTEHALADTTSQQSISKHAYRPKAPRTWMSSDSSKWLSTEDIDQVMRQYESARSDFKFMGVTPINFLDRPITYGGRCVSPQMCALDIASLVQGGRVAHIGVVMNMDKHDDVGSHWVAIYVGLRPASPNFGVFYYDSVAKSPEPHIASWMKSVAKILRGLNKTSKVQTLSNKVRRQFGQSECGIFSMMFLIACIVTKSTFSDICATLGNDQAMKAARKILFRPAVS